jgi:glycyl-tRNA synthetase
MDPQELLSLCKRRGLLWPAYDIYGGAAGFYDYGPLGAALKANIESHWRRMYVLEEGLQELVCPIIAPEPVFKASGHLDTFADMYVECMKCNESYRADHLAEGLHGNPATLKEKELGELLSSNGVKCPACKGDLTPPKRFNLMFKTSIGAGSAKQGYLRPETAQGMFVNFSQVYRFGREKLPVGAVQIGRAFRNEISPRQGLLRLREFNLMEAEVFFHPERKTWPRYGKVRGERLSLCPTNGPATEMTLADAVSSGTVANEALAYFMWLTQRFAVDVGVDPARMRFRQHQRDEMAHYATDCWDLEAETGYGWVELVGVADRGCYDVQAHLSHSGSDLTAFERFDEPKEVTNQAVRPRFDVMGRLFKGETKKVAELVAQLPIEAVRGKDSVEVDLDGRKVVVPAECYETGRQDTIHATGARLSEEGGLCHSLPQGHRRAHQGRRVSANGPGRLGRHRRQIARIPRRRGDRSALRRLRLDWPQVRPHGRGRDALLRYSRLRFQGGRYRHGTGPRHCWPGQGQAGERDPGRAQARGWLPARIARGHVGV